MALLPPRWDSLWAIAYAAGIRSLGTAKHDLILPVFPFYDAVFLPISQKGKKSHCQVSFSVAYLLKTKHFLDLILSLILLAAEL